MIVLRFTQKLAARLTGTSGADALHVQIASLGEQRSTCIEHIGQLRAPDLVVAAVGARKKRNLWGARAFSCQGRSSRFSDGRGRADSTEKPRREARP